MTFKYRRFTAADFAKSVRIEGGHLVWIATTHHTSAGKAVGHVNQDGYVKFGFQRGTFLEHHVVWLLTHGDWPSMNIDHIDGCKTNNAPSNLRLANASQNRGNTGPNPGRPLKGTTKLPHGKYQAACAGRYLGSFDTEVEAASAYDVAARGYYGPFARLNFGSAK